jgi:hypothetical protein
LKLTKKQALIAIPFLVMMVASLPFLAEYWMHGTTVNGPSMYPTWRKGRTVIFLDSNIPSRNLTGEIVSFRACPEYYTVHRVIGDNGTVIQTKGDNPVTNPSGDDPVSRNQIFGMVYKWCSFEFLIFNYVLLIVGTIGFFDVIVFWELLNE